MIIVLLLIPAPVFAHDSHFKLVKTVVEERITVPVDGDRMPLAWYRGNTHTHSSMSDGDSPPDEVAARYRDLGYDFLVLTDHNVKVDFAQYSSTGFVCIDGEEITQTSNHTNGLGLTSTVAPGSIEENVAAVLAQGGVPHLNHLRYSGLGASDALSVQDLELMEIYNYRTNEYDESIWDEVLTAGKRVYGVATDDCHLLYTESGHGWIMVQLDTPGQAEILSAIAGGDFYATTGVILDAYQVDSQRVTIESQNGDQIVFIGRNGRILQEVDGPIGEYVFSGAEGYVRARIENISGQFAWTQPIFLSDFHVEPFADQVIDSHQITAGSPVKTLGRPYSGKVPSEWENHAARVDIGGYLELDMGLGEEIRDREGPDLYIEEVDSEDGLGSDDPYQVFASDDAVSWVSLGDGLGDSYFDLDGLLAQARYIRVEVSELNAEIDGVEANFVDPYADWVLDSSGLSLGFPQYVLGPPTPGPIGNPPENYAVRIEVGGFLVLDLGPDEEVVDGPGDDLYVEEVDGEDGPGYTADAFVLFGSTDQVVWTEIGQGFGDTSFDMAGLLPRARYLRLEPVDQSIEIDGVWAWNQGITIDAGLSCSPASGTLPLITQFTARLTNNNHGLSRRVAARINARLASGTDIPNWRAGYTNLSPSTTFETVFGVTLPALGSLLGGNMFTLEAEDVTPAPYNQPPYQPAGDTTVSNCTVTGLAP